MSAHPQVFGGVVFLVHITGTRPNHIDHWRVYGSVGPAKGLITRYTQTWDGKPAGDWKGEIFKVEVATRTVEKVDI